MTEEYSVLRNDLRLISEERKTKLRLQDFHVAKCRQKSNSHLLFRRRTCTAGNGCKGVVAVGEVKRVLGWQPSKEESREANGTVWMIKSGRWRTCNGQWRKWQRAKAPSSGTGASAGNRPRKAPKDCRRCNECSKQEATNPNPRNESGSPSWAARSGDL